MKQLLAIIMAAMLAGCVTTQPETRLIPNVEYIVRIPPEELAKLPPEVANIDVDTATQADIASWIAQNEKRMNDLENLVIGIMKFLKDEQDKLDKKAEAENAEAVK